MSKHERNEIAILRERQYTIREVARVLQRSHSTIIDELRRNKVHGTYDPQKAHHKAYVRRHDASFRGQKIVGHDALRAFVEESLNDLQSPEAIAGRLRKKERHLPTVSKDTIYQFLDGPYGRLIRSKRKKKKRPKGRPKVSKLADRTFIDQRPKIIAKRGRVGDCEGDFIVSGRDGKGILLVVVDRTLRCAFLERILPVTIDNVHDAFLRIKERFPEMRSLTLDNDILFQMHKTLATLLDIPIYFCHPYHSWEKGSVEHVNKIIRHDIPKSGDLSRYDEDIFPAVEARLNRRFMKVLDYATPEEKLNDRRKRVRRRNKKTTQVRRGKKRQ